MSPKGYRKEPDLADEVGFWPICSTCKGDLTEIVSMQTNGDRVVLTGVRFSCPKGHNVDERTAPYRTTKAVAADA